MSNPHITNQNQNLQTQTNQLLAQISSLLTAAGISDHTILDQVKGIAVALQQTKKKPFIRFNSHESNDDTYVSVFINIETGIRYKFALKTNLSNSQHEKNLELYLNGKMIGAGSFAYAILDKIKLLSAEEYGQLKQDGKDWIEKGLSFTNNYLSDEPEIVKTNEDKIVGK